MKLTTYRKRSRSALPLVLVVLLMTCSPGLSICTAIHHHFHTAHDDAHRHISPSPDPEVNKAETTDLSGMQTVNSHAFHMQCTDRSHRHISVPSILNHNLPDTPAPMAKSETHHLARVHPTRFSSPVAEPASGEGQYRMTCFVRPVVLLN